MVEQGVVAAFLVGLLGGVHCVGMCGGVVATLGLGLSPATQGGLNRLAPYLIAYNLARLSSYTLAGAVMGGIGAVTIGLLWFHQAQQLLHAVAALLMVAMGLYLGGWWSGLVRIEQLGGWLWRRIEPFARRLLPVRSFAGAFGLGMLWGWLPCGLVYSVLLWAIATGSVVDGALLLLAFGLGTLPNLLLMGVAAGQLTRLLRRPRVRAMAALMVIGIGVWTLLRPLL